MNRRGLLILLVLVLGAVAFWLWKRDTGSTLAGPMADFAIQDTSKVSRIFIAETDGKTADLVRTPQGWTVNGMPANPHPIDLLLKTFMRVEVRSTVAKAAEANVLRVMSSSAKKVEIYTGGSKPEKIWYVGHATQDHYGTFMLLEVPGKGKSSTPFVMGMSGFTGFLSTRFHARLDEWRGTVVFQYPDLSQVMEVHVQHGGSTGTSFRVRNNAGALELVPDSAQAIVMDTTAAQDLMLQLKDLHFEYYERALPKTQRDSILASPPLHIVTVTEAGGAQRKVPMWRKPAYPGQKTMEFETMKEDLDRVYALLDDTVLVAVQRHLSDRITPPLVRLLKK